MVEYTISEYAKKLVCNGYTIVPLHMLSKKPIYNDWVNKAIHTLSEWERYKQYIPNIGIMTDCCTVIDFDTHGDNKSIGVYEEYEDLFLNGGYIVERTPSRGVHVYCGKMDGAKTYACFNLDGVSVDIEIIRGTGRQVVCYPSRTGAGHYDILSNARHFNTFAAMLPPIPQPFTNAIQVFEESKRKQAKAETITQRSTKKMDSELSSEDLEVAARYYLDQELPWASQKNHRHDHGVILTCKLLGLGLGESEVERYVQVYADNATRTVDRKEINGWIEWGRRHSDRSTFVPWKLVIEARKKRTENYINSLWGE